MTQFGSAWWKSRIKVLFCRFHQFLGLVNTFTAKGFSETSPVIHLNKHILRSQELQKYLTYEVHFLLQNIGNFMEIPKLQKQCHKKSMVFYIIWFELVTVISLCYYKNTRSWQSTCYHAVLKSEIRSNIIFLNSVWPQVKKKLDKSTSFQISGVFATT